MSRKSQLAEFLLPASLHLAVRSAYLRYSNKLDAEIYFLSQLNIPRRRFIDVGSNVGIYSYHFSKTFENVEAFEPNEGISYRLTSLQNRKNIRIHTLGLSDSINLKSLYAPVINGKVIDTEASLEWREGFSKIRGEVQTSTLDSFGWRDIDLIKIDVEGQELQVLSGAKETIKGCSPILLMELEARHLSCEVEEAFEQIEAMGYRGLFLDNGRPNLLSEF